MTDHDELMEILLEGYGLSEKAPEYAPTNRRRLRRAGLVGGDVSLCSVMRGFRDDP